LNPLSFALLPRERRTPSPVKSTKAPPFPAWKNRKYERTLPEDPEDLEVMIDVGIKRGVISTTVSKIESYIEEWGDAMLDANAVNHDRLISLEGTLEVMIGMAQTIKSKIGGSADIGEKISAPTSPGCLRT
jgi:hypothetical protein